MVAASVLQVAVQTQGRLHALQRCSLQMACRGTQTDSWSIAETSVVSSAMMLMNLLLLIFEIRVL